ncbi:MAG: hypothetical protein ACTSX0_08625 [Promethearchaeota archaeon]
MILKCTNCNYTQEIPKHCGKPMHIEGNKLICHMGAHCGAQIIPQHCGEGMIISE